ncbi:hypothetical protein LCGC14_2285880 [marine sediment metagenome]|uniref:NusG-like N-terminal domain-containing protein n=1 Tax=marine sediment metagenome TaxID=412755 RepID=A0A0F9CT57_9ZZZZ
MLDWHVVQSKPGKQQLVRAYNHLVRQKFETFLPWCWQKRKWRAAEKVPLFPYYLFVQAKDEWRAINSTSGVLRLLTIDDRPAVIKSSIVEKLQRQSDAHQGAVRLAETFRRRYVTTDKVKIIDGPFKSHVGEVVDVYSKEGRERFLLDIIGAPGQVWVDENDLAQ